MTTAFRPGHPWSLGSQSRLWMTVVALVSMRPWSPSTVVFWLIWHSWKLRSFCSARDCHDFRVWAGIMGKKESHYVTTQRRSEEHTSELQSLMRSPYAVFCL